MSGWLPAQNVAKNLATARKNRRVSQADLAHDMTVYGVPTTREVIANIETGRRSDIGVNEWTAMAACLGISPHLLLKDDILK